MASVQKIVLLGKTGVGKSASGNTILGSYKFKAELSAESVTQKCQEEIIEFDGKTLAIVDTPGLFHTRMEEKKVMAEIMETCLKIQPGPHVFLLVLSLNSFSKEDRKVLERFQKIFAESKPYTIVLFTRGGNECNVDEFIKNTTCLGEFIANSSMGYCVFNNEVTDDAQVTRLLEKISKVVQENKGKHYENEMLVAAKETVNMMMQQPELKKKEPNEWLDLLQQGLAKFEKYDPGVYKYVKKFLDCVTEVTYALMPEEFKS